MDGATAKIQKYLDDNAVEYEVIQHRPAASADEYHEVLGTRYEQQAKAIFIRYKRSGDKGFAVLAIQAQKRADMEKVRRLLEAREVRLATKEQLEETTGCTFGELPPLGRLYGLQLLMDNDLLNEPKIYFNAGDLSTSITLDPTAIQKVEEATTY